MIPTRYFLITLLALAGCQTEPRVPSQAMDVPTGAANTVPAPFATEGDQAVPPLTGAAPLPLAGEAAGESSGPGKPAGPIASEKTEKDASAPRILRGNNRVIATPTPVPALEGPSVSLNFEEAPVAEVVRTVLGDLLKVSYVLHPPLAGTVTLATRTPVPPDQAVFLLESALQANGLALMRDARGTYHVGRPDALRSIGGAVRQAVSGVPLAPGYGTIIVPLQYIGAGEMATILRPMLPADALVRVDNIRNLLVLAGTRTQAEGWMELVNTFDVDLLKGMSVGVFPLKYASIQEVQAALQIVSGGAPAGANTGSTGSTGSTTSKAAGSAGAAAAAAVGLGEGNPLFGALRIVPIERLNSILVVTPRAEYLDEARRWIERLDQPNDNGNERQLFIYQVQNVNAQHLATVLGGIFGGQGKAAATPAANNGVAPGLGVASGSSFGQGFGNNNAFGSVSAFGNTSAFGGNNTFGSSGSSLGGFGASSGLRGSNQQMGGNSAGQAGNTQSAAAVDLGGIRVIADQLNNSVLVWSTKSEYAKIESTLKRLDLPLTQVLIEASIVEVTLNDDLEYGLEWAFKDSRTTTGYTGAGTLLAAGASGTALTPLTNGFSYALKNPAGNITALLKALSTKTSVKVIASPSLMVLDNHAASINVGTQTPIQAGETTTGTGTGIVTTVNTQYKDAGVQLVVTPSVNSGNVVTMQVDQSVTDVGAKDATTGQPSFMQRQLSSKVAVRSGESIVMGGLIQDRSTTTKSGIPFLHTLPVLGNLFGSTTDGGARTELIVVITPRVVRSDLDIRQVSDDLRNKMQGLKAIELRENLRAHPVIPVPHDVIDAPSVVFPANQPASSVSK
ncbi:type II secretion system protein GspD [Simplicispira hankyongi]|uniref:Type II secretion system protein GspD n=2 Tax=Simplicispira hankyongi TaxID=2315688 RepID=A0A398C6D8_9BURK|nr:type II secretion system protein GspD [Simplicispira hankyongi]